MSDTTVITTDDNAGEPETTADITATEAVAETARAAATAEIAAQEAQSAQSGVTEHTAAAQDAAAVSVSGADAATQAANRAADIASETRTTMNALSEKVDTLSAALAMLTEGATPQESAPVTEPEPDVTPQKKAFLEKRWFGKRDDR